MTTDYNDIQFDNEPVPVAPSPVQPLGGDMGAVLDCARAIAKSKKLDCGAGLARCWGCKGSEGVTYPTLHCKACLEAFRARESETVTLMRSGQPYHYPRYSEASWRFQAISRNLSDPTYDQETCDRILANVRELPHTQGVGEHFAALEAVYHRRFGLREQRAKVSAFGYDDE